MQADMKRIYGILALAAVLGFAACNEKAVETVNTPAINVTTQKLDPNTDESGTVRAYVGTQVTAQGLNLDKVGAVKVDGLDAKIVSREMKTLVFEIPDIAKPQQDDPYMVDLEVFDADGTTTVFKYDYFVTIPVTDALVSGFSPASGTVGTEITISGRNLSQITSVSFAEVSISEFVSQSDDAIVFAAPAIASKEADTEVQISAVWRGGTISIDGNFTLSIPVFDTFTQAAPAALGDDVVLAGTNLDLVSAVKWGDEALLIAEQADTSITVKVPSGLEKQDPAVVSKALTAIFGVAADQEITVLDAFKVDTTPIGPAAPVFSSIAPTDTGYSAIFLGREVTVKGENFASVEKFKIDGIEVALNGDPTDIDAKFTVPRTIKGNAAKQVKLIAVWNGGNELDCGEITVYPFYYTKSLRLGKGCGKALYTDFDSSNAFLMLDDGVVISADDWLNKSVDPTCTGSSNALVTGSSKIATGKKDEYYAAKPYIFMSVTSNTQLQFNNPANSNSQLKNHRLSDLNTALPSAYGTPVVFMGSVTDAEIKAAVAAGTLSDISANMPLLGTSAPRWKQHYDKGDVLGVQYLKYEHVSTTGGKATDASQVYKTGYMYIRDITTPVDGSNIASGGYVEVDLYWSNVLE